MFNSKPNGLKRFFMTLPEAGALLQKWYGEAGGDYAMQIRSEILYITGAVEASAKDARQCLVHAGRTVTRQLMATYVLYRCYLAMGCTGDAKSCLLDIVKYSKQAEHPNQMKAYQGIREWANITTGWSGDTPRYHITPDGYAMPALEDRKIAIMKGIDILTETQIPFVEYAETHYENAYTIRALYMDIYYAVVQFCLGDIEQSMISFLKAYQLARPNDIMMPFIEYGGQILPMLRYVQDHGKEYDQEWIGNLVISAAQYEKNIDDYRK